MQPGESGIITDGHSHLPVGITKQLCRLHSISVQSVITRHIRALALCEMDESSFVS